MKNFLTLQIFILFLVIPALLFPFPPQDANTVIYLHNLDVDEIAKDSFSLDSITKIQIEGVGYGDKRDEEMFAYGWILNVETREPVWIMDPDRASRKWTDWDLLKFSEEITLPAGEFEVYFSTIIPSSIDIEGPFDFLRQLRRGKHIWDEDTMENFHLTLKVNEDDLDAVHPYEPKERKDILFQFIHLRDNEYFRRGFKLEREMNLHIYAIGEYGHSTQMVDFAWIQNADTRKRVWEMTRRNTEYAGGGKKNRVFNGDVLLKPGNYYLSVVTDDSHSYKNWNVLPPYDPEYWGITVIPGEGFDKTKFKELEEVETGEFTIVALVRMSDDEYEQSGFTLATSGKVHIYALGEYSKGSHRFVDYGWIEDAETGEKVWEMSKRNTEHAGGGDKNRVADDIMILPAGDYFVYYVTDSSHSYRDWNTAPPYDGESWGITVSGIKGESDPKKVKTFTELDRGEPIVEMTRIRNGRLESHGFTLTKPTKLRIYAIGEYWESEDDFADGAYIIDAQTREIVWQMTWRNTTHAGGGEKNRKFDGIVTLPRGDYIVYYRTDESHAYGSWNTTPPFDQNHWGVSIYGVGKDFDRKSIKDYSPGKGDGNIIAKITRVGCHDHEEQRFELKNRTRIRIYALGEGDSYDLADYGWIEDYRTGREIWSMNEERTQHAGGSRKNRTVNVVITLDEGEYEVHYRTDGSHAFGCWNSTPPMDPESWGITLTKAD